MKKIKKISMLSLLTMLLGIILPCVVSAEQSKTLISPDAYAGGTTRGETVAVTSSSYDSVRGDRTKFYFTEGGWLLADCVVKSDSREAKVYMYEEDYNGNPHDLVKIYTTGFKGYNLNLDEKQIHIDTVQATNIDSAGDPTAELYITLYVSQCAGDTNHNNGPLFQYHFYVD